ncbi:MAG: hypothetical protein BGO51_02755 [Rhodospirillales bacterium 69-11]|nr:DUF3293 domain-containing protein [Rhodospirillales bacterium]OJW24414.1 MAG: hypothetical protein BGO51_02755 [Rhodospirillales bacterium 69-11]
MSPPPAGLLRAYRCTEYRVAGAVVRIGRRSAAVDGRLRAARVRSAVLLTAWNPRSRRMPAGWNLRRQRILGERLGRRPVLPAEGVWHGWHEAHLLVLGAEPPICRIAWTFRQRAVVVLRRGQAARLRFNPG